LPLLDQSAADRVQPMPAIGLGPLGIAVTDAVNELRSPNATVWSLKTLGDGDCGYRLGPTRVEGEVNDRLLCPQGQRGPLSGRLHRLDGKR
jgi:hypothetical protein